MVYLSAGTSWASGKEIIVEKNVACQRPIEEVVSDLRKKIGRLEDRLVQDEGVLFALCNHFDLAPGQEIIRTGCGDDSMHGPFEYRGAVIPK